MQDEVAELIERSQKADLAWDRQRALSQLVTFSDPSVFPALIQALNDPASSVKVTAIKLLVGLEDKRAIAPLIKILNQKHGEERRAAAIALGKLKAEQAIPALIQALTSENADCFIQGSIIRALDEIGDIRAFDALVLLLNNTSLGVGDRAAETLGNLGDPRAVDPLIEALKCKSDPLRKNTARSIGILGVNEEQYARILSMLESKDFHEIDGAVLALGEIGDMRAFEVLVEKTQHPKISVSLYAIRALGKLGDIRVLDVIAKLQLDLPGPIQRGWFRTAVAVAHLSFIRRSVERGTNTSLAIDLFYDVFARDHYQNIPDDQILKTIKTMSQFGISLDLDRVRALLIERAQHYSSDASDKKEAMEKSTTLYFLIVKSAKSFVTELNAGLLSKDKPKPPAAKKGLVRVRRSLHGN